MRSTSNKFSIIHKLIARSRKLSRHFHTSGKRTQRLHSVAEENDLSKVLRYPALILRNWRASVKYFELERTDGHFEFWTRYNTITFLTDVLSLLKAFQKKCQSDDITLIEVDRAKQRLFEHLELCKIEPIESGWEQLFLDEVVANGIVTSLHGIQLKKEINLTRTNRNCLPSFTSTQRAFIINKLLGHLEIRLSLDDHLLEAFRPLVSMNSSTSAEALEKCHAMRPVHFRIL